MMILAVLSLSLEDAREIRNDDRHTNKHTRGNADIAIRTFRP